MFPCSYLLFFVSWKLGTEALAANEIALNVMSFGFMPAFAFGATATILVGQEIEKSNPLKAKQLGTETARIGTIFILCVAILEFLFAKQITGMYTNDDTVYELAALLIMVSAFLQLFDAWLNFYAGGLRGIGDTFFLLITSLILVFGVFTYLNIYVFEWGVLVHG
ncbi:MATE family efflux transporter [Chengkuizengella axinellae]|uniref:Probable multidrug resistance protein NorM n=1 Tax=Chengkuizengella axinellae TaxID=3064388 RepID=A0ABT9J0K0_9BACL|nr:MATE family efflux transporter [Chengkuizengella sp. 2205SS18-9]MDP5275139.1 MATE family efflux transporter [Chengkuizengella sp. 2205SS18-9]